MDYLTSEVQQRPLYEDSFLESEINSWGYNRFFEASDLSGSGMLFTAHLPAPVQRYVGDHDAPWSPMTLPPLAPLQSEPVPTQYPPPLTTYGYGSQHHRPSPSVGGPSASDTSSGQSDRHSTPWSSPGPSIAAFSPQQGYLDAVPPAFGGGQFHPDQQRHVSMHDIQYLADNQSDPTLFDEDQGYYSQVVEEGYHPKDMEAENWNDEAPQSVISAATQSDTSAESPNIRRRRAPSNRASTSLVLLSKVTKRPSNPRRTSSSGVRSPGRHQSAVGAPASRLAFPCVFMTYGCPSTFASKNEWKRHVFTQHMRVGYWRCDICEMDNKSNDFNRKDLFLQHVRRMHSEQIPNCDSARPSSPRASKKDSDSKKIAALANRCYHKTRSLPEESGCHFCDHQFHGPDTWDERMEHIGGHMETTKKANENVVDSKDWRDDEDVHRYLVKEGIIVESKGKRWTLANQPK